MTYDDVIPLLGDFGRYQKRIYFLLCLPGIVCAFHKFGNVFLQAKSEHRCRLPNEFENSTYTLPLDLINASYPWDTKLEKPSSCLMYDNNSNITSCKDGYIYDHTNYQNTIVMDWDMVCSRAFMQAVSNSLFMVGVMFGSIGFGWLSDKYGRKLIFFIALVIQVIAGLLTAIAPEFWSYVIARTIVASTTSGVFYVAYVISMEMVGPSDRLAAGVINQMVVSIGYILIGPIAYYITDWRMLQIAFTLPGIVFFCYWWFIPESARWLILNKRIDEAKIIIQKAAKENKVIISNEQLDTLLQPEEKVPVLEKQSTVIDLFRHPNLRKRSLIIFFNWFANCITYYGLSWNTENLGGNEFINFIIAGAVEIPAYTLLLFTLNKWGRKTILCGCMLVAGSALLLTMFVPKSHAWLVVTLAMLGKLAITSSYGTMLVFSVELFPTVIRNAGLGAASTAARVGGILAPVINILNEFWKPLPLIIFGVFAMIGGVTSLMLPETLNQTLPESIEDGEKFGRRDLPEEKPFKTAVQVEDE